MTEIKKDYIQLVCEATESDYESTKKEMQYAKRNLGVSYEEYFKNGLFDMTYTQQSIQARRILIRRENRNERFEKVCTATGWDRKEVRQRIREINDKNIVKMTLIMYAKYEIYRFNDDEIDGYLNLLAKRDSLKEEILTCLDKIDQGEMTYAEIDGLLNDFYNVVEKVMPDSLFEELAETISLSRPQLKNDPEECRKVTVHMEAIRVLLPFSLLEYVSFHFSEKSLAEIREFITDKERMTVLSTINDSSKFDILDNKAQTYETFAKYFKRDVINISKKSDFKAFEKFCKAHGTIVVKPSFGTFGKGVKAVKITASTDVRALFDELLEEYGDIIIEELIVAHRKIRKLNPDSVNTVRVNTYFDGEKAIVYRPFMKIGRAGSFVDNGGSGGIFVSVDPVTGRMNSNGCDENGIVYETHPDTGVKFNGYKLPKWDQAVALAKELADKIPGLNFLGWDFTYTKKHGWVIVEGNAKSQFLGQQCTIDKGVRKDFIELVGYQK